MSSFSVLGAPSKQIFEQVQPVPGVWEFEAEALQGAGLAGCSGQWQGSTERGQAARKGRRRRRARSAGSEVLAAAVLGLGPPSRQRGQGWGWREQNLGKSGSAFGTGRDFGQNGGSMVVVGY